MKTERSCGAVVFTRISEEMQYVIIQSKEGFYGFPKGHMEGSETEQKTAIREILEETGLNVTLLEGFRTEDSHMFVRNGEERKKEIVYFLAQFNDQIPTAQQTELNSIALMDFETAIDAFQFESSKRILTEAHRFLTER